MAEYIERDAGVSILRAKANMAVLMDAAPYFEKAAQMLEKLPAADVAPVVHGRWDDSGRYTFPNGETAVRCTNCGCALTESEYRLYNWNYCPVCGAKMDGGDNDEVDRRGRTD